MPVSEEEFVPFKTSPNARHRRPASSDTAPKHHIPTPRILKGKCYVIDGDTVDISGTRIRLAGIDAPEIDHPYGVRAKRAMMRLCRGQVVTAHISEDASYERMVAQLFLEDGTDLAAEMVRIGLAIDWPKYSGGKYRALEPAGIRKKLWRCDARQKGRLKLDG